MNKISTRIKKMMEYTKGSNIITWYTQDKHGNWVMKFSFDTPISIVFSGNVDADYHYKTEMEAMESARQLAIDLKGSFVGKIWV